MIAKQSPIYEYRNCNVIPNKQIVVKSIILSLMYLTIPKILFLGILQNRLLRIGHIVFEFVYINCQFFLIWNKQITNDEEYKFCTVFEYGIYLRIIQYRKNEKKLFVNGRNSVQFFLLIFDVKILVCDIIRKRNKQPYS